jgi:hypothetical protein
LHPENKVKWHASQNCFDGGSITYFLMKKLTYHPTLPLILAKTRSIAGFVTLACTERP